MKRCMPLRGIVSVQLKKGCIYWRIQQDPGKGGAGKRHSQAKGSPATVPWSRISSPTSVQTLNPYASVLKMTWAHAWNTTNFYTSPAFTRVTCRADNVWNIKEPEGLWSNSHQWCFIS